MGQEHRREFDVGETPSLEQVGEVGTSKRCNDVLERYSNASQIRKKQGSKVIDICKDVKFKLTPWFSITIVFKML